MASTISAKPSETYDCAKQLASRLQLGDVVALSGEMGAGKTHFVKGLADGLGYIGEVTSPTFTLIHEYLGGLMPVYHFDFFRIESEQEAIDAGLEDYLAADGVCIIEWADKFPALLPPGAHWFHLEIKGDTRRTITERP
ncbi:MAG: tRNA (adenosine(37)-N6)-threonylcarbamoyltransferase complex ATPase subunit type 1 TsaE [Chthoniobacteraceae bacterium]